MVSTVRLTVAQATIAFLANQYSERDGVQRRLIPRCLGIFGHGNVCGLGQALLQASLQASQDDQPAPDMPYILIRNEQAGVHAASGFAKQTNRLQTMAVLSSIGPGATNMVTGAALATTNRLPVLLLPADTFATRAPDPVLQQLESPQDATLSVNDAFRPVSRFWDRVTRPEQLMPSLLGAMRVLTDPADTGAVVVCLPQDVQAEVYDWPTAFLAKRVWQVDRPQPDPAAIDRAAAAVRHSHRPLLVAGGGAIYSEAAEQLRAFASATGIPVADTQAGKGAINFDHRCAVGGLGSTGAASANELAATADLIIGVGTRYSDFTTASQTVFANPDVKFVNLNLARFDAAKQSALMVVADAKAGLAALTQALDGWHTSDQYQSEVTTRAAAWQSAVDHCYHLDHGPLPAQTEVFGVLNELMDDHDVLINAAGSMPGDLQCLWRARTPDQYHVEYAYSCMGYEIPASIGVKLAVGDQHQVVAIVGDGTYQMLPAELATIVQEHIKVIIVLLDNHGFASIGALSASHGSQRFGTAYLERDERSGRLDGQPVPFDLAANAASWGANVLKCATIADFRANYQLAAAAADTTVLYIETDIMGPNPPSSAWWDVPVAQTSALTSTSQAYKEYLEQKTQQRRHL